MDRATDGDHLGRNWGAKDAGGTGASPWGWIVMQHRLEVSTVGGRASAPASTAGGSVFTVQTHVSWNEWQE